MLQPQLQKYRRSLANVFPRERSRRVFTTLMYSGGQCLVQRSVYKKCPLKSLWITGACCVIIFISASEYILANLSPFFHVGARARLKDCIKRAFLSSEDFRPTGVGCQVNHANLLKLSDCLCSLVSKDVCMHETPVLSWLP